MNKHTKGPWKTWGRNGCLVVDSNGLQVADTFHGIPVLHRADAECRENARRIVACINACEGFSDEELEGADLFKDSIESDAEIIALKKQRDELLEVVREFVQTMDSLPDSNETSLRVWDVYDTASKLIEKMQRGGS